MTLFPVDFSVFASSTAELSSKNGIEMRVSEFIILRYVTIEPVIPGYHTS